MGNLDNADTPDLPARPTIQRTLSFKKVVEMNRKPATPKPELKRAHSTPPKRVSKKVLSVLLHHHEPQQDLCLPSYPVRVTPAPQQQQLSKLVLLLPLLNLDVFEAWCSIDKEVGNATVLIPIFFFRS